MPSSVSLPPSSIPATSPHPVSSSVNLFFQQPPTSSSASSAHTISPNRTYHPSVSSAIPRSPSQASLGTVATTGTATGLFSALAEAAAAAPGSSTNTAPLADLPIIISARDVADTISVYNNLLSAATTYREALLTVSSAAAEFGAALENAARCKGAGSSAEPLLNAGGLHYLVSNHQQILARSIQTTFEAPVRKQVTAFKTRMAETDAAFREQLADKSKALRAQEKHNARMARRKIRNLAAYRSSLLELTSQIDEIDRLKYDHFVSQFDLAQHTSNNILAYAAAVVRAEVEIYEGIARKGWSGGGLDDLISAGPDPFAPVEEDDPEDEAYPSSSTPYYYDTGSTKSTKTYKPYSDSTNIFSSPDIFSNRLASTFQAFGFKDKGKHKSTDSSSTNSSANSPEKTTAATAVAYGAATQGNNTTPENSKPFSETTIPTDIPEANVSSSSAEPNASSSSGSSGNEAHNLWGTASSYSSPAIHPSSYNIYSAPSPSHSPVAYSGMLNTSVNGGGSTLVSVPISSNGFDHQISSSIPLGSGGSGGSVSGPSSSSAVAAAPFFGSSPSASAAAALVGVKSSNHVRQSNGRGIFSVLPTNRSILPAPPVPRSPSGVGSDGVSFNSIDLDSSSSEDELEPDEPPVKQPQEKEKDDNEDNREEAVTEEEEEEGAIDEDVAERHRRGEVLEPGGEFAASDVAVAADYSDQTLGGVSIKEGNPASSSLQAPESDGASVSTAQATSATVGSLEATSFAVEGNTSIESGSGTETREDRSDTNSLESHTGTVTEVSVSQQDEQVDETNEDEDDMMLGHTGWKNVRSPSSTSSNSDP